MKFRASILGGLAIFLLIECLLFIYVDRPLSEYLRQVDNSHHGLIDFFRAYTDFGKSYWYLWPAGVGVALSALLLRLNLVPQISRLRLAAFGKNLLFIFACVGGSGLVTDVIKPFLARARPVEFLRDNASGFYPINFHAAFNSMPSGHSTTAAALAGALTILFPSYRLLWIFYGLALMASRIMVNAHYVSDVAAGAVVGSLCVAGFTVLFRSPRIFPTIGCLFPIDRKITRR